MPDFTITFDVYCSCGAALCSQSEAHDTDYRGKRGRHLVVEPCKNCREEAKDEGDRQGYERGREARDA